MRWICCALALSLGLGTVALAGASEAVMQATLEFEQTYPGVQLHHDFGQLTRVYGPAFSYGDSAVAAAQGFVQTHAGLWGVAPEELLPGNRFNDSFTQPVLFDPDTGEYKFTLVYYHQYMAGLPVFGAELRLLVRNESANPLVLASSTLRDLSAFTLDETQIPRASEGAAHAAVIAFEPGLDTFTPAEMVIWAGRNELTVEPTVALTFVAEGITPDELYKKYRFVCDAVTGAVLHAETMIHFLDVQGTVFGKATTGAKADFCNPEELAVMPWAQVCLVNGDCVYADANGNYTIPYDGTGMVEVESGLTGLYVVVDNYVGDEEVLVRNQMAGGIPLAIIHNQDNTDPLVRAQINAYVQTNAVRDWVLAQNPTYPLISTETGFLCRVNRTDFYCPCNAWSDGTTINFCQAGSSCPNTAWQSVVFHEYGHHCIGAGGSGQGQYGEGMSDVFAMVIVDDPILGYGFFGDCEDGLRTADNDYQYPCTGGIHDCGQLLSGCVWSTRNELVLTEPDDYIDILSSLAVNSILLHSGDLITPQITIDWLTLDDDDDDITNGTPHYAEIAAGFGAHNMDAPPLALLGFSFPAGRPDVIYPGGGTTVSVVVSSLSAEAQPDSGVFYYNTGSGWMSTPMTEVEPHQYEATFPAVTCGEIVNFYFSANTTGGTVVKNPSAAPAESYSAFSAYELVINFEDDFNDDQGWTVQSSTGLEDGPWERGIPAGGGDRGDPPTDYDGSGYCFVTDNADGNSDVDGGYTWLLSPIIDLSAGDAQVTYALWYTNDFGADPDNDYFEVHVSNNGGTSWVDAQIFGPQSSPGWNVHSFNVGDYVAPTANVRVRFEASDLYDGSVVEAGVDAFRVESVNCTPLFVTGDLNCDGAVNFQDINPFTLALSSPASYAAQFPDCDRLLADVNGDGEVGFPDINPFVVLLTTQY